MINFFLQDFWMLQDFLDVARFFGCCKMLRAFGQLNRNISQHDPTMLTKGAFSRVGSSNYKNSS